MVSELFHEWVLPEASEGTGPADGILMVGRFRASAFDDITDML